jgi:hypothetical protein
VRANAIGSTERSAFVNVRASCCKHARQIVGSVWQVAQLCTPVEGRLLKVVAVIGWCRMFLWLLLQNSDMTVRNLSINTNSDSCDFVRAK